MEIVGAQPFSDFSRDVQSGSSSLGSGWATQGHSQICPEATPHSYLGCVLRVIVLLQDEPLPQSEVQSAATTMLYCRDDIGKVMSVTWFPSGQKVQSFFHQTREFCFSYNPVLEVYRSLREKNNLINFGRRL